LKVENHVKPQVIWFEYLGSIA